MAGKPVASTAARESLRSDLSSFFMEVNSEGEIKQPEDPLFFKIKNFIATHYEPVLKATDANVRMTTLEVYNAMQKLYPSPIYDVDTVANWLHDKGFTFWDAGNLRFEWLLKNNN